jgi:aspartyl-tRNA(Asn)/glutamyl-tRNA(Gln) amidotransferase subunit C
MLSQEEVKNIAHLARIGVTEEETEKYRKDLSAVLDFFQELQSLDTEGIEPIGHITGRVSEAREDGTDDFGASGKEAIRKNFPESKDRFLKVKSVF